MCRAPQMYISHQLPERFLEVSKKAQQHPSLRHAFRRTHFPSASARTSSASRQAATRSAGTPSSSPAGSWLGRPPVRPEAHPQADGGNAVIQEGPSIRLALDSGNAGAAILWGNVRVGLEDSIYLTWGVLAESNAQQVEKIAPNLMLMGVF